MPAMSGAIGRDVAANRPAAAAGNTGYLWTSTDVNGGTLYQSDGSAWHQIAGAVTGAASGGTTLLAAVPGTDGTTVALSAGTYAAFGTPWITGTLVTASTLDIIIECQVTWHESLNSALSWAIFRSGTQIFNTGFINPQYDATLYNQSLAFRWVDRALVAGSYTYEIRPGSFSNPTVTLANAIVTTPAATLAGTKGGSMLTVSSAANV